MSTAVPFGLTLQQQVQKMAHWREPIVLSAAAVVFVRGPFPGRWEQTEVLITERLKGAKQGYHQLYVGGYTGANDANLPEAACREAAEELGVVISPSGLKFVGLFGPALYESTLQRNENSLLLNVSSDSAEPGARFQLTLFMMDIDSVRNAIPEQGGDGEIRVVGWKTLARVVEDHGTSQGFLYPHILFDFIRYLSSGDIILVPRSEPGVSKIVFG